MKPQLTERALRHLAVIEQYIAADNPEVALREVDRILKTIGLLEQNPYLGRASELRRRRELVIAPYIAIYRVRRDASVEVVAIRHGAQNR